MKTWLLLLLLFIAGCKQHQPAQKDVLATIYFEYQGCFGSDAVTRVINRLTLILFSLILFTSCRNKQSLYENSTGFYRKFSYEKNMGVQKLDTSLSKKENGIIDSYNFIDHINDTFQVVYFFHSKDEIYGDFTNATSQLAFSSRNRTIYESDIDSYANGPGKEYILHTDSVFCLMIVNYYVPFPQISEKYNGRSVSVDYYIDREGEVWKNRKELLVRPEDTIDFKKNLIDPVKFKLLLASKKVRNVVN